MDKKTGLVAFFDILGYQNFLERNEPETAAEKIAEFMKKLKAFQSKTYLIMLGEKTEPKIRPILERIKYLVISDAILLTLETGKSNKKDYPLFQFFFFMYCSRFFKELFVYGLPVRGAIEYGEYVLLENQMFAGRPIVHAYQSAMDLDLSACKVSDSVGELVQAGKDNIYLNYNTPLRTGEEKELVLLTPFALEDDEKDEFTLERIPDLKQFVMESFCAHNKMINKEVQKKILNTEFFLRYCKTRWREEIEEASKSRKL
jgi:hypothetical protein